MTVSVIMPVYNTAEYLDEAVTSVIAQTYRDWELVAVDDGSTDGSGEMLEQWAAKDPRIRVLHRPNGGLSAARNTGLKNITGDLIQFLDSDDWLAPTALEDSVSALLQHHADMVIFDAFYVGMGTDFHERSPLPAGVYDSRVILENLARPAIPPYAWNKFCRRFLYDGVSFPEGEKWEDVATTFIPVSRSKAIAVLGKPLYFYRQRQGAITKTAISDRSIFRWKYLQYRKRYNHLKQHAPEIAESSKTSVFLSALLYYSWFYDTIPEMEEKELRGFLAGEDFQRGLEGRKIPLIRLLFQRMPRLMAVMIRWGSRDWYTPRKK